MCDHYGRSADITNVPMPLLLVFRDNNSMRRKHIAEFSPAYFASRSDLQTSSPLVSSNVHTSRLTSP